MLRSFYNASNQKFLHKVLSKINFPSNDEFEDCMDVPSKVKKSNKEVQEND